MVILLCCFLSCCDVLEIFGARQLFCGPKSFADNAINFAISIYRAWLWLIRPWSERNVQRICGQLYQFALLCTADAMVTIYGVRSPDSGFRNPRTPESAQQACRQSRVVDCALSQLLFLVFQMSFGHFTLMDISLCGPPSRRSTHHKIALWLPRNFCLPYWGCPGNSPTFKCCSPGRRATQTKPKHNRKVH